MRDGNSYPELVFHGGDLADAAGAGSGELASMDDWLDLSTGINPTSYPLQNLETGDWTRLPGRDALGSLLEAAQACYGAPGITNITAGSGSQALIQALPGILPTLPVTLVAPTYGGHAPAWEEAGFSVTEVKTLQDCDPAGITVLVNPNNPDGRIVTKDQLADFSQAATRAGGWLVVDEAFGDLDPSLSAVEFCADRNVVVLKSFGKFYGLAGIRLGFAISPASSALQLSRRLGPWAINGPALRVGAVALSDSRWQASQRKLLAAAASRLDGILINNGLSVTGGTSLFRLLTHDNAQDLYAHLLTHAIYVRRFPGRPSWLRLGLPDDEPGWARLETTLSEFRP